MVQTDVKEIEEFTKLLYGMGLFKYLATTDEGIVEIKNNIYENDVKTSPTRP